jgi:hypothetical protein
VLVNDWLKINQYKNVGSFDYYSVLTNGGNTLAYPSGGAMIIPVRGQPEGNNGVL